METEMKTKSKISGHIIRGVAYAVFLAVAFTAASWAFDSPSKWYKSAVATVGYGSTAKSPSQPRAFSFADRVEFQRAIEDVYWRHRIWPKENPDPKPSLDAVMSQAQLENKVAGYLRDSLVLQDYWQRPITAEQLQAETERMARNTKQPEILRELFEALGNDPAVIAECLARPILAERSIADLSAQHQTRQIESPQSNELLAMSVTTTLGQVVYTLPEIADAGDPCIDQWIPTIATTISNVPHARSLHTAVWTGSEMIVWGGAGGGDTGGRYNPSTDSWTATSITNAPSARYSHTSVWSGSEMIVWGGNDGNDDVNSGGRYNPSTNTWTATSTINAPTARGGHTAIWTGSEMIVWGGYSYDTTDHFWNTGGRYNPGTNTWTATSTNNAPTGRYLHTAVWTSSEMIVWGGIHRYGTGLNTGGRYDPGTDSWTATSTTNAPNGRWDHTAVWTGSEMIVWGGRPDEWNTGGRYNPSTNSWRATSTTNASYKSEHTAVWTGREMIVWGGVGYNGLENTGGRYDPGTDSWIATSTTNAPDARYQHTAIWTGSEMIVWGGESSHGLKRTGGRYCGQYTPSNDDFADAIVISTTSGSLVGTNTRSTTEVGEPAGENSVWYRWVPASTGDAQLRIGMDWLKITVYTGAAIDALTQIAVSSGTPSSVHWTAVAGTTYQIRLTKNTRTADFTLAWSLIVPPPNDAFASAILLTGANGTVTGTNVNATDQSASGEPAGENSVWYRWTAPGNGTAHFNIGMDWLTIDVYTGTAINALTRVATSSGSPSTVNWTAVEGTTYRIRLTKNTRTADFHLLWTF
jgi:N-acetylneuraminic acid mutarotase